jgi:hypothetical protein
MGKLTVEDVTKLQKAGVLNKETVTALQKKGLASSKRINTKHYMQTKDGKWVIPTLYWRGARGTESSKHMIEFNEKFNTLINEYTTTEKK